MTTTTEGAGSAVEGGRGARRGEAAPNAAAAGEAALAERAAESASPEVKRPVWNKMAGGDAAAAADAGPVMGAASWPALSKAAASRGTARVSGDTPPVAKPFADGSVQAFPGPVIAPTPTAKAVANNNNATSSSAYSSNNHPTRQKSFRGEDRNAANGGPSPVQSDGHMPESSPRDTLNRASNWESGSRGGAMPHSHPTNDQQRNSYRRGHGGRPQGEFHDGHRSRRDQDRNNYEWSGPRNFNGRDAHMQQARPVPRGFPRAPPNPIPFIPPPLPFVNPMGYPLEMPPPVYYVSPPPHPDAYRGFSLLPPPPPAIFSPGYDPGLRASLLMQIDYYFSDDNLCKDRYLRKNMDEQGWVPVSLIAGFTRIKKLTEDVQVILEAMQASRIVEVQGDKMRRRNEWMKWLWPRTPTVPLDHDSLANRIGNVALDEGASNQLNSTSEGLQGRSMFGGSGFSREGANEVPAEASHVLQASSSAVQGK